MVINLTDNTLGEAADRRKEEQQKEEVVAVAAEQKGKKHTDVLIIPEIIYRNFIFSAGEPNRALCTHIGTPSLAKWYSHWLVAAADAVAAVNDLSQPELAVYWVIKKVERDTIIRNDRKTATLRYLHLNEAIWISAALRPRNQTNAGKNN